MTDTAPQPGFWDKFLAGAKKVAHVLLGPVGVILLVAGAVIAAALGMKNVQVGGLIGLLLGKKAPDHTAIDTANSIPAGRVDTKGQLIPVGQADSKGMTQAAVVAIQSPGIFSNPDTVKFTPPGASKPVEVALPVGVKANDVEHVVVVQPGKFAVTVKDSSGISAQHVDDLLKKYS
jgi:hypothetical protein